MLEAEDAALMATLADLDGDLAERCARWDAEYTALMASLVDPAPLVFEEPPPLVVDVELPPFELVPLADLVDW